MKQLNKPSDNMGGIISIWAVPPTDITIYNDQVSFSTTDNIVAMYCSQGSISFSETENETPEGTYKTKLSAFIPKDSPEANRIITGMSGRRWIVIYIDQNEYYKCAGTTEYPLRVLFDLSTGSDTPDRNGHSVEFYGIQVSKAIFISNPFGE